ncbi:uncharacterized protein LOC131948195 [Physella acuta]|uniref:uncharacterized protein LOC131948195 n=1 Tax=Physella acuta TaxID=109671 RepID=UPI0027DB934A|nr:uncharacterized protein LOC131948195 [Physella acuta]
MISSCSSVTVRWFVESRQPEVVLQTDASGAVVSGSNDQLRTAGMLRAKVKLPNDNNLERFLSLDTIEYSSTQEVSALSMRILKTRFDSQNLMRLDASTLGVVMLLTSGSTVKTRNWQPGLLTSAGTVTTSAEITWYLSK